MMGCASSQGLPAPGGNAIAPSDTDPGKVADDDGSSAPTLAVAIADKYPPAEAFVVSLDDVDNANDGNGNDGDDNSGDRNDSLIKKHPPKRLQKLVEQAATAVPPTTIEHLEEKLAKAEVRRQQYIQQRIDNIVTLKSKGTGVGVGVRGDEEQHNEDDDADGKADVIVSSSSNGNRRRSSSSSQDADVVLQKTASSSLLKEASTAVSLDKKDADEDDDHHERSLPKNGAHP